MRGDGSVLVTAVLQKELWWRPRTRARSRLVDPVLLTPSSTSSRGSSRSSPSLHRQPERRVHDARIPSGRSTSTDWAPGRPGVDPRSSSPSTSRARGLNGSCLLGPGVMLVADSFAGLIWRIDLAGSAQARRPGSGWPTTRWRWTPTARSPRRRSRASTVSTTAPRTGYLWYTSTAQKVFMRVAVDPATLDPAGSPSSSPPSTTPTTSAWTRTPGSPTSPVTGRTRSTGSRWSPGTAARSATSPAIRSTTALVGPSGVAWGRGPGDLGRVAYVTTDGGTTAPPDGIVRRAALLRAELSCGRPASANRTRGELMTRHVVTTGQRPARDLCRRARTRCRRAALLRTRRRRATSTDWPRRWSPRATASCAHSPAGSPARRDLCRTSRWRTWPTTLRPSSTAWPRPRGRSRPRVRELRRAGVGDQPSGQGCNRHPRRRLRPHRRPGGQRGSLPGG